MLKKILIADDNGINRRMLIHTLCQDYDILEAENGKEAISILMRNYNQLSAVLLDIKMPIMDGYEVLQQIRADVFLSTIPVIMVTGSEDEESRVKALSYGANDFIVKPFNPDIVKHCLKNNIALRETISKINNIQRDKLTNLYNREGFFERVEEMIKEHEAGFYVMSSFDIDNFKLYNEQYGMVRGDLLLKKIASCVADDMEEIGGIGARITADNFAVLLPASNQDMNILQQIQDKKLMNAKQQTVNFSVGRYLVTDTSLYDRAYIAKQSIKGRYDKHIAYFDEKMLDTLLQNQSIVSEMEKALVEKQFEAWFQPQYNHATGALIGSEALVRWRHPQKGIIPPGLFIPLFEQNGFIYELDKYVWRQVCSYLRKWMDEGRNPLPVSVNISRYDVFRTDLINVLMGLIEEYNIPLDLLRLEITESAFSKSTQRLVDFVRKLVELGFTVEIDDFGSGYSSLNTLKNVPAQEVKLDMLFLEDQNATQRGGNIIESIVRMAKWIGMTVIAEGVETKEQADFLKSIGCSYIQGYLYAKPMPADEFEEHCKNATKENRLLTLETVEEMNNNAFWNPNSIDTLIFNSYVGAACIFEFKNGSIEMLRVTDKYAKMLSNGALSIDEILRIDMMKHMDLKESGASFAALVRAIQEKKEYVGEFLFLDLPKCPHKTYLRSTLRTIARAEDRFLIYCISENITAQYIAESKQHQAAEQLKQIINNINCGITATIIKGDDAEFLVTNDKYYEILGYTKKQYQDEVGNEVYSRIHPGDRDYIINVIKRLNVTGQPISVDYRVIRRDDAVVWVRSFLSKTSLEGVTEDVQLCTFNDITTQKHLAEALLDNLPCGAGICVANENDAHMIYLNKKYLTYFNHHGGIRRATNVYDVIHPEDRGILRSAMKPALGKDGTGTCVVRIMDGPGEYIPFRLVGSATESVESDHTVYVMFVPLSYHDFNLGETLPLVMDKVMESSTELSFVKDKNLRYLCCSNAFLQMVGLEDKQDLLGKTDYDLFAKELAEKYMEDDYRLMENGEAIIDLVEEIPSVNGQKCYTKTTKHLLTDTLGNIVGIYGIGHPVD